MRREVAGVCRVEIVADQGDARRQRKVYVHQVLQDLGASQFRAARRHLHLPPAPKRRRDHKQVGCAHTPVFVILATGRPGSRGQRSAPCLVQNLRDFVHTHHRMWGIQRARVGIQDLFPGADKITVRLRLQAPAADFPRLQPVFSRATRTVSWPMLSPTCSSTSRSASRGSVTPRVPRRRRRAGQLDQRRLPGAVQAAFSAGMIQRGRLQGPRSDPGA